MAAVEYATMWRVAQVCCGADSTLAAAIVEEAVAATALRRSAGVPADPWRVFCQVILRCLPPAPGPATVADLRRAICDLPRDQRLAVALLDVAGLEPRRAAAAVGMTCGGLLRLRRGALAALRGRLAARGRRRLVPA